VLQSDVRLPRRPKPTASYSWPREGRDHIGRGSESWLYRRFRCRGLAGSGFQAAMVRAHSRASALSVTPGNNRRSSTAAANSPPWSKAARMAAASASETANISGAWERWRGRTSDVLMTAAAVCWCVALARVPTSGLAGVMPLEINRAPVLTLWAAVVAERLGHPVDTALTFGRAVAGSAARVMARNIGREERKSDRDADRSGMPTGPGCGLIM
jgi:hypothetical protein